MRKQQFIPIAILATALAASPMMATESRAQQTASNNAAEQGEQEVMLIDEDFSKITAGSETDPDLSFNINSCEGEPPDDIFFSCVKPEYTHQSGWGSYMVYPAGGALYFHNEHPDGYAAHLNPPLFDASDCNGTFFVRFRARLTEPNPTYKGLGISTQDATDPDNVQYISFNTMSGMTSTEWQTYEMRLDGGTKKTRLIFREEYGTGVLIDDIQIYQLKKTIESPKVLHYLYYNGTSFRPRWNKVEGATKYYVNVFESDAVGTVGKSIVSDLETADTICTVRGLTPGVYYRYNVAASDGTTRSLASRNMVLNDILAPSLNDVNIAGGEYTATWEEVPGALFYNYYVYADRTADADGEFALIDEDFTGITDAGGLTGYTNDLTGDQVNWTPGNEPDTWRSRPYSSPLGTKMAGYYANNWIALDGGYVFLDGWFYFNDQKEDVKDPETDDDVKEYSKFETPVLDLTADGGKLKVSASLWGMPDIDVVNTHKKYPTNANIALVTFDAVLNQYVETECHHFDLSEKWSDVSCEFTKGTEDSKIVIYTTDGPGVVYIDNFKVTQQLKKGDSFASCIACQTGLQSPSANVTLPEGAEQTNLYHRAIAVTEHESKVLSRTYYYFSGPTELTQFHEGTGATAIAGTQASAGSATAVARYAADGTLLAAPVKGVNIIKMSDGTTRKVVVK